MLRVCFLVKTIWIIIFLVVLLRSIWRRMERTGSAGRYEEPVGTAAPDPVELPPEHEPGERGRRKLNLPDYITGRGSGSDASGGEGAPRSVPEKAAAGRLSLEVEGRPGRKAREVNIALPDRRSLPENLPGQTFAAAPRRSRRQRAEEYFIDFSDGPEQVLKGIVWAEILGPRGGRQMQRRK